MWNTKPPKLTVVRKPAQPLCLEQGEAVHVGVDDRPGNETGVGRYLILWKDKEHWSRTHNAAMPFAMYFSQDGKAIHQSSRGYVVARSYERRWTPANTS